MKIKICKLSFAKNLAILCTIQLGLGFSLYAQYDLDEVDIKAYNQHYNLLPCVEENDSILKRSPHFDSFLIQAEEIVTRYELEPIVGLRLIHRHFSLNNGQTMTETYEELSQVPSLVSSGQLFEEAEAKGIQPASWIFSSDTKQEPLLFEASNDPAIKTSTTQLERSPDFMDEIGQLLRTENLNDLISLAILKRDKLVASEGQVYMETSFETDHRSIVQLWDASLSPQNTIRTSWSFKGPKQHTCFYEYRCALIDGRHVTLALGHHN